MTSPLTQGLRLTKNKKKPLPKTKPTNKTTTTNNNNPETASTTLRTDQELEAEARQTQLDLGFVMILSEHPQKALRVAKTDLEREAAINAIEVQKIVSKYNNPKAKTNTNKIKTTLLQNDKAAKKPPLSMPNLNLYPNLAAAATPNPQPTTNINQMKEQFENLKKQQETVDARQRHLQAQRTREDSEKQVNDPPIRPIPTSTTTTTPAPATATPTPTTTTTRTTSVSTLSKLGQKVRKLRKPQLTN